jgi:hypothetical protein
MTKHYCDRCGCDLTGKTSGAIQGVKDADDQGQGMVTDGAKCLCRRCYLAVWKFLRTAPTKRGR